MKMLGRLMLIGIAATLELHADTAPDKASALTVELTDRQGQPVANVVVYAEGGENPEAEQGKTASAIMDQMDTRFVPHILAVETGTEITFPNHDVVSHHVYSFSETKRFELPLYKGTAHAPLVFDAPGLVVVGCNIHDNMLGYIVVVDTPYFAKTDTEGRAELEGLPAGEYSIHVWTPRLREKALPEAQDIALGEAEERLIAFQFTDKLFPPHSSDDGALTWSEY